MDQQSRLSQVHNNSSHDCRTASYNWNNEETVSSDRKDKRATGGLN